MSRNRKKTKKTRPITTSLYQVKFLLIGLLIGLFSGGIAAVVVTSMNNSHVMNDSRNYHPATFVVAEKFLCGCSKCNMELTVCDCSDSDGGFYELFYISEKLKAGLSEIQVIKSTQAKFGRIKNKYKNLIDQ